MYVTQTRNVNSDHSILDNIVYHTQPSSIFFFFFTTFPFPLLTHSSFSFSSISPFSFLSRNEIIDPLADIGSRCHGIRARYFFSCLTLSRQYETTIYIDNDIFFVQIPVLVIVALVMVLVVIPVVILVLVMAQLVMAQPVVLVMVQLVVIVALVVAIPQLVAMARLVAMAQPAVVMQVLVMAPQAAIHNNLATTAAPLPTLLMMAQLHLHPLMTAQQTHNNLQINHPMVVNNNNHHLPIQKQHLTPHHRVTQWMKLLVKH